MMNDSEIKSRSSCQKKRLNLNIPSQKESEDTQLCLFSPYYTSVLDIVNDLASTSILSRITLQQVHLAMKQGEKLCL